MKRSDFTNEKWYPRFILGFILIVLLFIIYRTFDNINYIFGVIGRFLWIISPLLFGVLFAYFLYAPCKLFEKLFKKTNKNFLVRRARGFSVLTIFILLVFLIILAFSYVFPILIASAIDLANSLPLFIAEINDYLYNLEDYSAWNTFDIAGSLQDFLNNFMAQIDIPSLLEDITRNVINIIGTIVNVGLGLIISLYLLLELEKILAFFKRLGETVIKNERKRLRLEKYLLQINKVLFTFIAGKGLNSIINVIIVTTMLFILNVPYYFLLGLIAGLLNFIPYLGSMIAVALITIISLLTGGVALGLRVIIPLIVFQQMDGNYIEPRIMKSALKISPILVITSVLVGGAYFGIWGMFFAVPIATMIKQILLEYTNPTVIPENDTTATDVENTPDVSVPANPEAVN